MKKFLIVFAIFYLPLIPAEAFSSEREVELEPIIITPDEFQQEAAIPTKNICTVDMRENPSLSPEETLDYQRGADVERRGILGIQSDLSMRGSTPEQSRVAINGIIINNPQTAHHNLDLGLPSGSVEKIEVTGQAAPTGWAQGAMGSAVNFITKRPTRDEGELFFMYGTDQTHKSSLSVIRNRNGSGFGFQAEEVASDGWRYDTDFRECSLASSGLLKVSDKISSNLLMAYGEKEFGAAGFYGRYDSKEWTNTQFFSWDFQMREDSFQITPGLYFKRHHDKYMLDIERPDYYLNHHRTDLEGIMLRAEQGLEEWGLVEAAADISRDDIKSSRLGKHSRSRNSFFLSWRNYRLLPLGYDLSLGVDDYSEYDPEILPQAGLSFRFGPHLNLRSSVSKSARPPTYTELYYDSPANKGNKDLSPEEALSYEIGLDILDSEKKNISFSCTIFRRDSSDLIDWIKQSPAQAYYQAKNITELKIEGMETEVSLRPVQWLEMKAGYVYLDSDIEEDIDYISKYALNHPDHKITTEADFILPFGRQKVKLLYKDRKDYAHYFIMGLDLSYKFVKESILFIKIENIFNSANEDIKDTPLPGRQIQAGVRVKF